ncbi:unnamed protein product [Lymnaea stagnalis]|uniref:Ig-like domain-containing protein n=1 Tax=Lymnaea stagnalis TaxID=6523 RepID=A0AAV2HF65_LYMST
MASGVFRLAPILFVWLEMLLKQRITCTFTTQTVVLDQKFNVSITVPDTGNLSVFRFSLDRHNGSEPSDVIYIYRNLEYKLSVGFLQRMVVTVSHRTFDLTFEGATPDLAGTYRCYEGGASTHIIPDCGQLLALLRKPEKPTVVVQKKPVLSETLELECRSKSNSLPPDHNLGHVITWKLPDTIDGIQGGRIRTTENGHLLFADVRHFDIGLAFSCTFADKATVEAPQSDASDPYYIVMDNEGGASHETPFHSSIFITSPVQDGSVLRAAVGKELRYTCHYVCSPACDVSWSFDMKRNGNENFEPITDLATKDELVLNITNEAEGAYRCTASNSEGSAHVTFHLQILK